MVMFVSYQPIRTIDLDQLCQYSMIKHHVSRNGHLGRKCISVFKTMGVSSSGQLTSFFKVLMPLSLEGPIS